MSSKKVLSTPRGKFLINELLVNEQEARNKGYGYAFSSDGYDIYLRYPREYHYECALVPNGR